MSSNKKSIGGADTPNNDLVELSAEESVEATKNNGEEILDTEGNGLKRKSTSGAWAHFVDIELQKEGKIIKKHRCIHCKKSYAQQSSGATSHLLRHLNSCPYMKWLKGTKGFINFQPSGSDSVSEIGVLMSIASILDPRFKKVSISWTFERLYPTDEVNDRVEDVINKLKSLYEKYSNEFHIARASKKNSTSTSTDASNIRAREEDDFYAFLKSRPVETSQKNKLEVYLEEPNYLVMENQNFDVLKCWSQSSSKFPVLSKMTRNIFCIPITTVASESAFSAEGRILDDYRSSLTKDMVKLLVCGGDWIKSTSKATIQTLKFI